ncbi:MAG: protein translocase subunit SecF [Gemmatimonadetes bacterium]|nr:protein translocase subunit SecF [Gemmatimonadota bacterium]
MVAPRPPSPIEFTGGTLMQLEFKQAPDVAKMRAAIDAAGVKGAEIQQYGSPTAYTVRARTRRPWPSRRPRPPRGSRRPSKALDAKCADGLRRSRPRGVGPQVGSELRRGAVIAILVSFLVTLGYLAFRFEWRFGVAAVIATAHDILATLAFIKLLDLEISLTVIAAILTVVGYSLNDTIIIFDRVRENLRKKRKEPLYDTLNRSVNETLPRSVLTHARRWPPRWRCCSSLARSSARSRGS